MLRDKSLLVPIWYSHFNLLHHPLIEIIFYLLAASDISIEIIRKRKFWLQYILKKEKPPGLFKTNQKF
jgi:hypothetical protein